MASLLEMEAGVAKARALLGPGAGEGVAAAEDDKFR